MTAGDHQTPVLTGSLHNNDDDPKPTEPPPHFEILNSPLSHLNDHSLQLGITRSTLPKPISLTSDTGTLTSPANGQRRRKRGGNRKNIWLPKKRKRGDNRKNIWLKKKIQNLTHVLKPIPFVPTSLDLSKHEDLLKRLGLYEFSKVELDTSIRTDLLVQLILSYDPEMKCSHVHGKRIGVNREDLARALELPAAKQDKEEDSQVFSAEAIGFIEDFLFNWVLLDEHSGDMPLELLNLTRCIRDGHPDKLDSASLIWYKVEKELTLVKGTWDKLDFVDCYYASHLQQLIRSQRGELLKVDGGGEENMKADEECEEKVSIVQDSDVEKEEQEENVKVDEEHEEKEEHEQEASIVQDSAVKLTLGPDVENLVRQDVREDDVTMVDAEEHREEVELEKMEELVNLKNDLGEHILQHCQNSDMNNYEETKVKEVVDEQIEQVDEMEEQVNWKDDVGEHILQRCQSSELNNYEEAKVDEFLDEHIEQVEDEGEEGGADDGERCAEGFDMEANNVSIDRDGLTDHIPQGVSAIDLCGSRDNSYLSHSGPSFFDNSGKRLIEPEEEMHHLHGNSKSLQTDQKQNDFGSCMVQMQHWLEKAKMIRHSNEEVYVSSKYHHDSAMNELRERNQVLEMIIKSKDGKLVEKHAEVYRLQHELHLMVDLLAGYRKALNDTQLKFSEYRKRVALQEEPLYKDAGRCGLVLSARELDKQRLKQEEDKMKFQTFAKLFGKIIPSHKPVEKQKSLDKQELSSVPVENQKSMKKHELSPEPGTDNDASM